MQLAAIILFLIVSYHSTFQVKRKKNQKITDNQTNLQIKKKKKEKEKGRREKRKYVNIDKKTKQKQNKTDKNDGNDLQSVHLLFHPNNPK